MIRFLTTASALSLAIAGSAWASNGEGKKIFDSHCASCHQSDGSGVPGTFPPLKDNTALQDTSFVIATLLNGLNAKITVNGKTYHGQMPAWSSKLSDQQIAEVLTYVRTQFNRYGKVTEADVKRVKSSGDKPGNMLSEANEATGGGSSSGKSNQTGTAAKGSFDGQEMDSAALEKALGKIRFNPPFPADVEKQNSEFGEMVKLGYLIFTDTQTYAPNYVRNGLNCRNCHLEAGALAGSAPLWGAFPNFPTYRGKNHLVNSFENRLQGCFLYSENGIAPPSGGEVLTALSAYSYWLSLGTPTGLSLDGRGYPSVKAPHKPDVDKGGKRYAAKCALCHGDNGQGTKVIDGKGYQFPPLWGPDSYNWGAGMHKDKHFADFIKANMPLGQGGTLSDQDAADIAAWVNQRSHARPTRIHDPGQAPNF